MPDHPTRSADPAGPHPTHSAADPATTAGTDATPARPAPTPGAAGRYDLGEEIARGGMGVIYRATDTAFGREIAVKVLQERFVPTSGAATRFLEEAQITGQLQHPAIPPVHDVGSLPDGRPFLAMKLIKGDTLAELLRCRTDPASERGRFLAIFEQVCQAVAFAHDHKVIHRDLKPANVMVGNYGEVQVMDWGLAKVLTAVAHEKTVPSADETVGTEIRSLRESDGTFTQVGSVLGTPGFMPPEQAAGEVAKIDERADVFGLGAVLAVILTGQPPYVGPDGDAVRVMAIRGELAGALGRLDACGAEPGLVALARRCLAFAPSDRPRQAGEVARAVAALRAEAEDRARRAELERARAEVHATEQRKRRRVQAVLAVAVVAALAVAAGSGWRLAYHLRTREAEKLLDAEQNAQAAELALSQAERAMGKENPNYGEIDAALSQAERRLADGGPDHLRERFASLAKSRKMLDRLDEIDTLRWSLSPETQRIDATYARNAYPVAFREYGIDLSTEPSVSADQIRRSPIVAQLTAALDQWLSLTRTERS